MAGTAAPIYSQSSSNPWLQGILWGTQWSSGGSTTVISTYVGQGEDVLLDFNQVYATFPWAQELAAIEAAMASFEAVCNIDFQAATSQSNADVIWASVTDVDAEGALGWANPPMTEFNSGLNDFQSLVVANFEAYHTDGNDPNLLAVGSFDYITFIHELGHAVGLAHPHDNGGISSLFPGVTDPFGDLGDFNMNQGIYTMMSYNDGWATGPQGLTQDMMFGFQAGPMALDIAALQFMYGANMSHRTGNDTYALPEANEIGTFYSCIWDAGGVDTILGAGSRANAIDLRAATLQVGPGGGGFVSYAAGIHGGFTIANGAVIENATGGGAKDVLRGNAAANTLIGLGDADILEGDAGNDVLNGGAGADTMRGGIGNDTYHVDTGGDVVDDVGGTDTVLSGVSYTLGTGIENLTLQGQGKIDATGNWLRNTLIGNGADNILDGKAGADTMRGGGGNDVYRVDNVNDVINDAAGAWDAVFSSVSYKLGIGVEILSLQGAAPLNGTGNQLANVLVGNGVKNTLKGELGNDHLFGGKGQDTLIGGGGNDQFIFENLQQGGDIIRDFGSKAGNNDRFVIDVAGFKGGLTKGKLSKDQFQKGSDNKALDDDVRFIFDTSDKTVWFDKNGDGRGGLVLIADLQNNATVDHNDFLLI